MEAVEDGWFVFRKSEDLGLAFEEFPFETGFEIGGTFAEETLVDGEWFFLVAYFDDDNVAKIATLGLLFLTSLSVVFHYVPTVFCLFVDTLLGFFRI